MGTQMDLPDLPSKFNKLDYEGISASQFTRKNLKSILHLITGELKKRGTKTPHVFLPFRSKIDDYKLEKLLTRLFPHGELIKDDTSVVEILKNFDEFTLICGLKYLWSRLPNNEIIGWDVYLEYKRKEREAGYPKVAFLSIMPKCLSSPAHASIVYDFLDLLISLSSNSQYNYLSGRKIAKMSSIWAFNTSKNNLVQSSAFYDATIEKENNFVDGLNHWQESTDAIFHLLLSFLRAMLPENEMETLKLPKTLQSLLITNNYPPLSDTDSIKSIITIPCVSVKSTKRSSNPYELISKVRHVLSFDKKDSFVSIENYTILKSIFEKQSTNEIVSSLTEESRRVLTRLAEEPINSNYGLYPGWLNPQENRVSVDPNIPLFSEVTIKNVSIQDYYIWAWLSSLASDQPALKKAIFGRSLVVEAGLRGFQKWLILTEEIMSTEEYMSKFKSSLNIVPRVPEKTPSRVVSNESYKDMPLPPPPPPSKDDSVNLLPDYQFGHDNELAIEVGGERIDAHTYDEDQNLVLGEMSDYTRYLQSLNISDDSIGHKTETPKRRPPPAGFDSQTLSSPPVQTFQPGPEVNEPRPSVFHQADGIPYTNSYSEPYSAYETQDDIASKEFNKRVEDPYSDYFVPNDIPIQYEEQQTPEVYITEPQTSEYAGHSFVQPSQPEPGQITEPVQLPDPVEVSEPTQVAEPDDSNKENEELKKKKKKKKDKEKKRNSQLPYPFPGPPPPGMIPPPPGMENMGFFPFPGGMPPSGMESPNLKKNRDKKKKKKKSSPESSPKQHIIPRFEITPGTPESNENSSPKIETIPQLSQPKEAVRHRQPEISSPPAPVDKVESISNNHDAPLVHARPPQQKPAPPVDNRIPSILQPTGLQAALASKRQENTPSPDSKASSPFTSPQQENRSPKAAALENRDKLLRSVSPNENLRHKPQPQIPANPSSPTFPTNNQKVPNLHHSPHSPQIATRQRLPASPGVGRPNVGPVHSHPGPPKQATSRGPSPTTRSPAHRQTSPHGPTISQQPHGPHGPGIQGQGPHGTPHGVLPPHGPGPHVPPGPPRTHAPPHIGQPPDAAKSPSQKSPPPGQYYPPPQGYYPPAPGYPYYPPPQGYYPPPQGYPPPPPQGYPPPPQGYPPPPQGFSPQGYPPANYYAAPPHTAPAPDDRKKSSSDVAMMGMPTANRLNKNKTTNKADLRNALVQGSFGI